MSDVETDNVKRIHLMGTFYGANGTRKSGILSMGEWSAGGRKRMKTQADIKELGDLYKLRWRNVDPVLIQFNLLFN